MVGPVTPDNIDTVLKAEIDKALKAGSLSRPSFPGHRAQRLNLRLCTCHIGESRDFRVSR